ncbi:UrcA family protein [Sphingomonas kyungheensis]|uniref:UrcA family protein n=1 Tax=Sphingomonas kyungheensis TaxID=1069987 RepID=A0ABU8H2A0_9SPHN
MIVFPLCVAALTATPSSTAATNPSPDRRIVQTRIITQDLDLRTPEGQRRFRARVRWAAQNLCGTIPKDITVAMDVMRCIGEVRRDGAQQLAKATGQTVGGTDR